VAAADLLGCVDQMGVEGQMPWNGQNTSRSAGGNMSPKIAGASDFVVL